MSVKEKIGIVVSNKMIKTCIVAVNERVAHKRFHKVINKTKRYPVQDSGFGVRIGDKVRIRETRPISKTVRWTLTDIIKKSTT